MTSIRRITVKNIKAIDELDLNLDGCTAIVTGGNDKGKSTALSFLTDRLLGEKPELILRKGEEKGSYTMELTDGSKFEYTATEKTEKIRLTTSDDIKVDVTKEISKKYFGPSFDIDKFLGSGPQERVKMLKEFVGVDTADVDSRYKSKYDERAAQNKLIEAIAGKIDHSILEVPTPEKPLEELRLSLDGIQKSATKRAEAEAFLVRLKTEKQQLITDIEYTPAQIEMIKTSAEEEIAQLNERIRLVSLEADRKVKEATEKMEASQKQVEVIDARTQSGEDWLDKNPPVDVAAVNIDIATWEKKEAYDKAIKELDIEKKKGEDLDTDVKAIAQEKQDLLKSANLPDGIEIDGSEIKVDGLPLSDSQVSSSKKYIAALKIAAMALKKVRALHFDAAPLDKNNVEEIIAWAHENSLQLLIERPDFDGGKIEYTIERNEGTED